MKIKVKVKQFGENRIQIIDKGDWIDLRSTEKVEATGPSAMIIPLNVAMELPKGYEAIVAPRSSTYKHFKCIPQNGIGIIDNSYSGTNDQWKFPALFMEKSTVDVGQRVAQFRIQLSQKATMWQKIKHLFSSGFEFVYVDVLNDKDRGGFGTTGR